MRQHLLHSFIAAAVIFSLLLPACKKEANAPTPVPDNGLVAYYAFNGNALDGSPFANNGNVNGVQFVYDRKNQENKAAYFDGIDDFVKVPHNGAINFGNNQNYTISCWVKCSTQENIKWTDNYILGKWDPDPAAPYFITIQNQTSPNQGQCGAGRTDGACGHSSSINSKQTRIDDDVWHLVVIKKEETVLFVYIDGEKVQQAADNSICNNQNMAPLLIATQGLNKQGGWFKGTLDELRIYNRALTDTEIKTLFEA